MSISSKFKLLCLPSKVYFVLAMIGIIVSLVTPSVFKGVDLFVQFLHLIYVVFWTWVLHLICKAGYNWISWVLVIMPFVVFFLLFAFVFGAAVSQANHEHQHLGASAIIGKQ